MSTIQVNPYLDALTEAMKLTMEDPSTIFIGQQIVYYGNPMSKTIDTITSFCWCLFFILIVKL